MGETSNRHGRDRSGVPRFVICFHGFYPPVIRRALALDPQLRMRQMKLRLPVQLRHLHVGAERTQWRPYSYLFVCCCSSRHCCDQKLRRRPRSEVGTRMSGCGWRELRDCTIAPTQIRSARVGVAICHSKMLRRSISGPLSTSHARSKGKQLWSYGIARIPAFCFRCSHPRVVLGRHESGEMHGRRSGMWGAQ